MDEDFEAVDMDELDPYLYLRLLAENPANADQSVVWHIADIVNGGWLAADDVYAGVRSEDRILVVTEGSSDMAILRKALPLVAPDIADFFYFVDMDRGYPFTGTGNVYRFCQGLARIQIQNRMLVVLDNDAAGCETYQRLACLGLPTNMHVTKLPDLRECGSLRTLGPSGEAYLDVNGCAVSIEMFLDLARDVDGEPTVQWTGYNEGLRRWQGQLVGKSGIAKAFLRGRDCAPDYALDNLRAVWDSLYAACTGEVLGLE